MKFRRWIITANIFVILLTIGLALRNFESPSSFINRYLITFSFISFTLVILFRPKFLNRTNLNISLSAIFNRDHDFSSVNDLFSTLFFNQAYYLKKDANIEDFCVQLSLPHDVISNYVLKQYSMTFIDLINKNRVDYFVELINSGEYGNHTLESLATLAGFGSRQNLYRSFRKHHGGTPTDLLRAVAG